ncbi:MAG: hypothetical protein FJW36_14755 [Acidobacteria bacterium]|nr:hypothetical protein [Acidobacteriota bacterium]
MAYVFILLLACWTASGQSVLVVSPSGDRPSVSAECPECPALREADGFALEPWIRIRFDAPADPNLLSSRIQVRWGATRQTDGFTTYPSGYLMPINLVAWEPSSNTLYAKPDEALDHDRDYTILYNNEPISRFHTRNVTRAILSRRLGPAGTLRRTVASTIDISEVRSITALNQTAASTASPLTSSAFPAEPGFLAQLGLRRLVALDFESSRGDRVAVHAWLPNSPKPAGGWPVKLIGHGLFDSRFSGPTLFASAFIGNSVVMAIDAVGHGYGPNSVLRFERTDGGRVDLPTQGRGRDINNDGRIEPAEGCILIAPGNPDFINTCLRETALDYQKLVREIQNNIDLDGDPVPDLDSNSVQYLGQSLGAMYGTILTAIEPSVDSAVLNVGGGSTTEISRSSTLIKGLLDQYLAAFYPQLAGVGDPLLARFAPSRNITPNQAAYLEMLDRIAIIEAPAAPASFAPFLKQATLFGNPIKRVLFQYATGDQSIPNNANGQLIRSAFEYELVSVYRHDLARRAVPNLPENPHAYMAAFAQLDPSSLLIALATLTQASDFLASGRREVPDVNGLVRPIFRQNLFETPILIP